MSDLVNEKIKTRRSFRYYIYILEGNILFVIFIGVYALGGMCSYVYHRDNVAV